MDGRRARALLGVPEHATPQEIRNAFRERVLATHPDRGGDRASFELIVLAYETLQHADMRPAPRPRGLYAARGRWDRYDSPPRPNPERRFADVLRAAMAAVA